VRHSVDSQVPDRSIAALYPLRDNYVMVSGNRRSPKSLVDLCTDSVCRHLPDMDGELPPGLPQDIVDAIVKSLVNHSALNATTLRALRHCEIGELSLAGCRGVGDDWLRTLNRPCAGTNYAPLPCQTFQHHEFYASAAAAEAYDDPMELDTQGTSGFAVAEHGGGSKEICDASSCSTSSFVSASSTPFVQSDIMDMDTHAQLMPPSKGIPTFDLKTDSNTAETYATPMSKLYAAPPHAEWPTITNQLKVLDLCGSQRLTDRGLLQLGDLRSLEVAKLDNCHSLVGRGLLVFSSSENLHTLSLANCRRLTDEAVVNVSHLTSLQALILDGCRCLTDRSLAAISELYQLQKLDLTQCDLITNSGLDNLHDLRYLDELSLGWCRNISDDGLILLSSQPFRSETLRVLRFARCLITDRGIGSLVKLTSLQEINLNGCSNVTGAALGNAIEKLPNLEVLDASYCPNILRASWQGKIRNLKTLELCYSGVRDSHLSHLTSLPNLEELNLDSCPVGDWAMAHLADNNVAPNLTSLDLADTDLTDLGIVHLPKFTKMKRLSLFYCNITNAGLRHLASMPALEVLNLDSRDIGDDGVAFLRGLKNLKSLDIFSGRITDSGCAHLAKIKSLESLELCGGGIGDLGCAYLASLDNLTSLNLSQNERITNRGAASLAALTNLKALNLSNTKVTSAALRFLGGLFKLQSLAMYGCRGIEDSDGLHALQQELPSLRCLRLNSTSDNDGIVDATLEDSTSEVDDEDMPLVEGNEEDAAVSLAHMRRDSDSSDGGSSNELSDENGDHQYGVSDIEEDFEDDVGEDEVGHDEMEVRGV